MYAPCRVSPALVMSQRPLIWCPLQRAVHTGRVAISVLPSDYGRLDGDPLRPSSKALAFETGSLFNPWGHRCRSAHTAVLIFPVFWSFSLPVTLCHHSPHSTNPLSLTSPILCSCPVCVSYRVLLELPHAHGRGVYRNVGGLAPCTPLGKNGSSPQQSLTFQSSSR